MDMKMPRWFVSLYLRVKGWQGVYDFRADCNNGHSEDVDCPDHPIRWLWEKIQQGCTVTFSTVHGWDRQVGRDTGDMEAWGRWIDWQWNHDKKGWECIDMEYNVDGFTVIPEGTTYPKIGTIIAKTS